jgi:hypothetical protein
MKDHDDDDDDDDQILDTAQVDGKIEARSSITT